MKFLCALFTFLFALLQPLTAGETKIGAGTTVVLRLLVPAADAANVTGEYVVSDAGTVRLPYLDQEVTAAGLTPSELAARIEKAWVGAEIYTAPRLMVQRTDPTANLEQSVYVSGEVRSGGAEVPFKAGLRLLHAITRSGGFTEFAKVKNVKILRDGKTLGPFDMSRIDATHTNNPVLEPEDQIIVPQD